MIVGVLLNFYLLSTVGADNRNCLKPGRIYVSRQLSELTALAFRAIRVDIPLNRSSLSNQNPVNCLG